MIDEKAIEEHIRGILAALGDDPEREGLRETPRRVAKMYAEVFAGMNYTNHEIAQMFGKTFEDGFADGCDDEIGADPGRVVVMKDIDMFSYCEHHMALMYDMKATVAYVPGGKVIGLSKNSEGLRYGRPPPAAAGEDRQGHRGYHHRDHRERGCGGHDRGLPQLRHGQGHQEDEHQDVYSGAAGALQNGPYAAAYD